MDENTPTAVLEALAKDDDANVREAVAWNRNTPAVALEILSKDEDSDIRIEANKRLKSQYHISAAGLKEAKAEKDVRDTAVLKQEQHKKREQEHSHDI